MDNEELVECYELMLKAARRCCYDLGHVVGRIPDGELKEMYQDRQRMWETIFEAGTGVHDYRHRLHMEIFDLECNVRRLRELALEAGADEYEVNKDLLPI